MGHSKDVDSYPQTFLQLSALMRVQKRIELGPMSLETANKMRGKWYAFVRAHYYTIERDMKRIRGTKDKMVAANMQALNNARELRLDTIKKFEVQLLPDGTDLHTARLLFIDKQEAYGDVAKQVDLLFSKLPVEQQQSEEEILTAPISRMPQRMESIEPRNDPALAEFFKPLSIDERIRMGAASEADFLEALKTSEFDSLAAQVNTFSSSAVDSATQELLRAEMLAALLSARAQLDSPGERGYPAQDLGGRDATSEIDLTEFIPQTGDPVQ